MENCFTGRIMAKKRIRRKKGGHDKGHYFQKLRRAVESAGLFQLIFQNGGVCGEGKAEVSDIRDAV
jgi:hypothetical protein